MMLWKHESKCLDIYVPNKLPIEHLIRKKIDQGQLAVLAHTRQWKQFTRCRIKDICQALLLSRALFSNFSLAFKA